MNISGTLRKRKRRNLSKVNGLTMIQYNEAADTFTGDIIQSGISAHKIISTKSRGHTALSLSSNGFDELRRNSSQYSGGRITRQPTFHSAFQVDGMANEDFEEEGNRDEGDFTTKNRPNSEVAKHRPFLISNTTVLLLKVLVYLGTLFGTVPWRWNEQKYKIERQSDRFIKFWRLYLCYGTVQTAAIFYLQFHAFTEKLYSENSSNREAFMSSMAILWTGGVLGKNVNMYLHHEKTRVYLNALLDFNRKHVKKYVIHLSDYKEDGTALINPLFFMCDLAQILISTSLFLRLPFQPWYFFSYIYPKPWYWLIPGAIHEMTMVGQCLSFHLLVPWAIVAHTNTLQFWLREIHNNNDTDYTIEETRAPKNALEIYKAMQILNRLFNECMATIAIPSVKIIWAAAIISCGYVLLRSMNHLFIDEFPGILSFPFAMFACCIKTFVILTMSAEVDDLGCSFLDSWSCTKQKNFRRILMSCSGFQIWTARFYYISVPVTITYFMQVFGLITDCIITFP